MDFVLTPGVPGSGAFMCADETSCDWEKVTLCAFAESSANVGLHMQFLDCMDSNKLPLFYSPVIPKGCAGNANLTWSGINKCFNGPEGGRLLLAAQKEIASRMGTGSFTLPTVLVNNQPVCAGTQCDYATVAASLGRAGFESSEARTDEEPTIAYYFSSK